MSDKERFIDFQFPDSPLKFSKPLTENQRLLLYGDTRESDPANQWKALWDSRPDHPPYFVEYAARSMEEHDALPPDFLKIAEAIDPDNGWYLAAAAAFEGVGSIAKGSLSRKEQDERKPVPLTIEDMAKHQAALGLLQQAMEKPRFTSYSEELLTERIPLFPDRTDFVSQFPAIAHVMGNLAPQFQLRPLAENIAAEAQRCGTEQDEEGYRKIRDLSHQYYVKSASDGCYLIDPLIAKATMVQGIRSLRTAAEQLGFAEESEAFQVADLTLKPPEEKRGAGARKPDETGKLIEQRGGVLTSLTLPLVGRQIKKPIPITNADLTPERRASHALLGRIAAVAVWVLLGFALVAVVLYRFRHSPVLAFLSTRNRDLLKASDWAWIIGGGCLFPILWYWTIAQLSPLAAHHWNLRMTGFIQPSGQFTSTGWVMLTAPIVITRWRLSKRAPFLGMKPRYPWLGWLAVGFSLLAVPLFGAITHVGSHGATVMYAATAALGFAQLWWLTSALVALFGKPSSALFRQSVARCLVPTYATGMTLAILASPLFHRSEIHWTQQDWLMEISVGEPSAGRYEYRVTQQLKLELQETLGKLPR